MWKFTNKYVPNNTHGKISKFSRNTQSYGFFRNLPPLGFSLSVYEQDLVAQD